MYGSSATALMSCPMYRALASGSRTMRLNMSSLLESLASLSPCIWLASCFALLLLLPPLADSSLWSGLFDRSFGIRSFVLIFLVL